MQTACSTVMKQPPEYSKAWSFRTMLTMPPIPHGNQHSVDITTQILRTQILPARPDRVAHIEARYKSAESSGAVLSLEGYLQHSSGINWYQLYRWFHATWTPVGGRLTINAAYKGYRASMSNLDSWSTFMSKFTASQNLAPAVLAPRPRFVNLSCSYTVVNVQTI
jgi:hypothetical protein